MNQFGYAEQQQLLREQQEEEDKLRAIALAAPAQQVFTLGAKRVPLHVLCGNIERIYKHGLYYCTIAGSLKTALDVIYDLNLG